ncbi:MAG: DUF2835 domain-containing protein [Deltaproteobacteria bacterium]|jgi:hypothetical protein|nr:DUF2835 domain-containing protein [Deltaproteobacteria bacterium]
MAATPHQRFYFRLQISQDQFLRHYQGSANSVQVVSECGKKLRFPATRLRPLLMHNGIHGRFCLTVDTNKRFVSLQLLK